MKWIWIKTAVFCGSSTGNNDIYIEHTETFGKELANNDKTLVFGVILEKLKAFVIAHDQLTDLHVVQTMHERKAKMADLADGFVALPGDSGTFEEWFEAFTWWQLGYHTKPCGLLNVHNFFDPLINMLDHTIEQGFMNKNYRYMIIVSSDPKELLEKMDDYTPDHAVKWM